MMPVQTENRLLVVKHGFLKGYDCKIRGFRNRFNLIALYRACTVRRLRYFYSRRAEDNGRAEERELCHRKGGS
jgi:hypothetical protein